jgi:hypothetical protein
MCGLVADDTPRRDRGDPHEHAGIFIFPKLAAVGYLLVTIRGVLVIGGEGRLGLRALRAR